MVGRDCPPRGVLDSCDRPKSLGYRGRLGLGSLDSCDRGAVHRYEPWRHRRRGRFDDKSAFVEIDIGIRVDRHSDFKRIDKAHFEMSQFFIAAAELREERGPGDCSSGGKDMEPVS